MTADEPMARAEDVSFALMVVLERLAPVERVVFVLRTVFDLDFTAIGAAVRRDAVTCREIFSHAGCSKRGHASPSIVSATAS